MRHLFDILAPRLADLAELAGDKLAGLVLNISVEWIKTMIGGG